MSVSPVGSTSTTTSTTGSTQTQYVTITQPDGSTYRIPQTKATWDPESKTWKSNASAEATATAQQINRKYGESLDSDDFMKLLVAQFKYQDPSKPADTSQMMQQTAAMSMVERVNEMATSSENMSKAVTDLSKAMTSSQSSYGAMLMEQRMSSAVGLVGKSISYADATDPSVKVDGVVDSVKFDTSGPILVVGGKDVPLASVSSVKSATSSASSSTTPSAGTTSATGSTGA